MHGTVWGTPDLLQCPRQGCSEQFPRARGMTSQTDSPVSCVLCTVGIGCVWWPGMEKAADDPFHPCFSLGWALPASGCGPSALQTQAPSSLCKGAPHVMPCLQWDGWPAGHETFIEAGWEKQLTAAEAFNETKTLNLSSTFTKTLFGFCTQCIMKCAVHTILSSVFYVFEY